MNIVVLKRTVFGLMHTVFDRAGRDLCLLFGLLGQQNSLDVWQDTTLGDGNARQQFVQFFVVADGQLQMTGDDSGFLVVTGSVSRQLEHLRSQILHDGRQVDWGPGTDPLGIVALPEQTVDATDRELQSSTAGTGLCLHPRFASFATARHCVRACVRVSASILMAGPTVSSAFVLA